MSFTVEWDWPARRILLERLPWPASSDVAIAVYRFARERAPHLPAGRHGFLVAGYRVTVRVNHAIGTVVVLSIFRVR